MHKRDTYLTDCRGDYVEEGDLLIFENAIPEAENWYDEYLVVVIAGSIMPKPKKDPDARNNIMLSLIRTGRQRQYTDKIPEGYCKFRNVAKLELPARKGGLIVYSERPAF